MQLKWFRAKKDETFYYWMGRWYTTLDALQEDYAEFRKIDPKTWGFTAVSTYGFDAYVKGRCATNCWIVSVTFLPLFIFHLWMMMGPL